MTETIERMGIGVAARCWCDEDTASIVMDERLAEAFAKRADAYLDQLETAWGLIANASNGDWEKESEEWREAAMKWRDRYHATLSAHGDPS